MRKTGPQRLKPIHSCFMMYGLKPVPFSNRVFRSLLSA